MQAMQIVAAGEAREAQAVGEDIYLANRYQGSISPTNRTFVSPTIDS